MLLVTEFSSDDNRSAGSRPGDPPVPLVRHAAPGDAEALGMLLAGALAAKYRPALGRRAAQALTAVIAADLAQPRHGYVVAAQDGRIVGTAHLAIAEDPPPTGVARRLAREVGWWRAIWALGALSILAHGPLRDDEAYVGEVAVASDMRRRGVGEQMMTRLDEIARAQGKARMTLWVTDDNVPALALYARLGFTARDARRWRFGRVVFGSPGIHLLEKRLDDGTN